MKGDVKRIMYDMMENYIDKVMNEHNFKRKRNSFIYSRTIGTTKQKIEMVSFLHPTYHPGALAHIYPWLEIYFPEINRIAEAIVEDNCIKELKNTTIRQPVQVYFDSERWMLMNENESKKLSEEITQFLVNYTIPLLDNLKCIEDYLALYVACDKRLIMDDIRYIFIISAYILQDDYENARKVLEERFGKPGLRKKYSSLFAYLEKNRG